MPANETKPLSYLNITVSEKGLSEFRDGRRVVFIPKEEVQRIELGHGSGAEYPLAQMIMSGLLIGMGAVGAIMVWYSRMRGLRWGAGLMIFGALGVWFLYETLKKTHYLRVTCRKETRKLILMGAFQEADFHNFAGQSAVLGYHFAGSPSV